jgi:hypothetical protein
MFHRRVHNSTTPVLNVCRMPQYALSYQNRVHTSTLPHTRQLAAGPVKHSECVTCSGGGVAVIAVGLIYIIFRTAFEM